ncbi:hypothetical protein ACFVAQ_43805 [Streptomyces sp. NPDC057651]|uniref:barstar family protein n=1 Tax=unclassified Streptomyces TaxID=2593676 RepID=UPI0036C3C392
MHQDRAPHEPARYALIDTESGHTWGECLSVDGLFAESPRETYELLGWQPTEVEPRGWIGDRVWLVPRDETLGPWLLEDVNGLERPARTGSLVLTGLDDYEGPPEGYREPVRVHNEYRPLGVCREFARILPAQQATAPLVLVGLAPSDRLRRALAKGTRRALDLEETALEVRDNFGAPFATRLLWTRISAWRSSSHGMDLIDLELDGQHVTPVPAHARPLWQQWMYGPPRTPGAWAQLGTRQRLAWFDLVRQRRTRPHPDRPVGHTYELDGRHVTDQPGLYLSLGEAINGPGGYFGTCLAAVDDCLRGGFGYTSPATLLWHNSSAAREHLSRILTPDGQPYDLFAEILSALAEGGMHVTLA